MASITVYPKLLKMGTVDKTLSQQFKQFNKTWNKADFLRNCKDENEEPADLECLIVVLSTCQPSLHQQPEMREMLYKRCRWFDEDPQPANMSSSTSSHQRNRSRTSPKQLFQVAKLRKKVLPTTVSPLMEVESEFGPSQTPAASNNATQVIVQVSFPPNLVPREKRPGDEVAFHPDTFPLMRLFTSTESWKCNQSQK